MFSQPYQPAQTRRQSHRQDLTVSLCDGTLTARVYVPSDPDPAMHPLLALHGISRNADAMVEAFAALCAARGQVLIVPRFSRKQWPHFQQIGKARADRALLGLLSLVRDMGFADTCKVSLFGYSGGAQLAHRFAMLYPQRIAMLHLAAAGWYCLPDQSLPFPMGLGETKEPRRRDIAALARAQLNAYLELPVRLYVGEKDVERDEALRKSPRLDEAQGLTRVARGKRYATHFCSAAQAHGVSPDLAFTTLPGCAHSFPDCAQAGLAALVCA